jgi:ribosomal protein S18 acetylase RimI-like enzyme
MLIRPACSAEDIIQVQSLFREYADSLEYDLCFQSFEQELAGLPGAYAPRGGVILLAMEEDRVAGCIALRPQSPPFVAEMKRLYVRPQFRRGGTGRALVSHLLQYALSQGYTSIRLDTLPVMTQAIAMYRSLGFREIAPYTHNPVPGALFLELSLLSSSSAVK